MVDVIVYKPSPYGLVFIHDTPLGFNIYHIKHERVYVSYDMLIYISKLLVQWWLYRRGPSNKQSCYNFPNTYRPTCSCCSYTSRDNKRIN